MPDRDAAAPPRPGLRLPGLRTVLGALGGTLLMAMMALTVCDVIGRYLFNSPVAGAAELTEILLAAVIFLGLGAVSLEEAHVTVDLATDRMPAAVQPLRQALTGLAAGAVLAVVAWRIWIYAAQIGGYGGSTSTLGLPLAPLGYFCALACLAGALLTAGVPLARLLRSWRNEE
ncbi:TRAP transporter small permease [Mangrovicoccus sp. HB182678]|uniref:TRAP transporter small permease protein n=2 Tax=Mangrovicoccus algicola TaxID=2771008 RepID=A0A8J6YVD1_9RHOB|nr:TRAP transporter small permease [Mangrovicoccus algicola]